MTPEERAKAYWDSLSWTDVESDSTEAVQRLASEIKSACAEAYLKGLQAHPCCCESTEDCDHEDEGFSKGFSSGYARGRDDSANAVSDLWLRGTAHTAQSFVDGAQEKIRRLTPPEEAKS